MKFTILVILLCWVYCLCAFDIKHNPNMGNIRNVPKSIQQQFSQTLIENSIPALAFLGPFLYLNNVQADESQGQLEFMPALQGLDYGKPRTFYPDYQHKPSGLQYKVVKEGTGDIPRVGDRVTVDWEGYTIGYYGRPFETRNKVKGGAFESTETDYFRWIVGSGSAIQALDEAVKYLKEGSIAQVIIPAELGYPVIGDPEHDIVGPKPSTFSGKRALNFVLENSNLIDKTLLLNIKIVRIDKDAAASSAARKKK